MISARSPPRPKNGRNGISNEGTSGKQDEPQVAHTLTACVRCRTRKTRCDPGLPRCTPCERANAHCEYFDATKNAKISRNYVVHLQKKVLQLEEELAALQKEEQGPNPEEVVSSAAAVRLQESPETKFLGPSSGIAITRLVMQLAKQFTDSQSISEIVPQATAQHAKEQYAQEEAKPDSKVYPLISNVAAEGLPKREVTDPLVELFCIKVQHMYPLFHEPTLLKDVEAVYNGSNDPYQNFVIRMVIAIGLQKLATQWAGLADSYYLAALKNFEAILRLRNLKTLQCLGLVAEYSIITPTRTASYYIVGLAARLVQALGLHEEHTIVGGRDGKRPDFLEIDMRRRLFWCIYVMECGLSHSLGRTSVFAMAREHVDVEWFATASDEYITEDGILPGSPGPSLKKWIAIHFFKMRRLQLEIRRKLYLKKRPEPVDDSDPWFQQMEEKLITWRDSSPLDGGVTGLDPAWFHGRYNTMIVFLFRPSPQVPRPSTRAALLCFEACRYNVYLHLDQIRKGNVDLTWIFTQSIFMAINTMLWSLSYSEVRNLYPQEDVRQYLSVAIESMGPASERWPGVASASELYQNLIEACLKIYEKDGDVPISTSSPSEGHSSPAAPESDMLNRSRTTSPQTASTVSVATPPDRSYGQYGYWAHSKSFSGTEDMDRPGPPHRVSVPTQSPSVSAQNMAALSSGMNFGNGPNFTPYDPSSNFNVLPTNFLDLYSWDQTPSSLQPVAEQLTFGMPLASQPYYHTPDHIINPGHVYRTPSRETSYFSQDQPYPWQNAATVDVEAPKSAGLSHSQQMELLQSLETHGMGRVESLIQAGNAFLNPSRQS